MDENKRFRIIILGAGFSKPAGLPLGIELFAEIRRRAKNRFGLKNHIERDLTEYVNYRRLCDGQEISPNDVDLEQFMSFLDIEHYLGLRGSDTLSKEGNESQVMIKRYIGQIIQSETPSADKLPEQYYEFAEELSTSDILLSFNYDLVLERALEHINKPYRLFPSRYSTIGLTSNTVDSTRDEVVLLKMHGSVNWFDIESFEELKGLFRAQGFDDLQPNHGVFRDLNKYEAVPIVDGPRNTDDPLAKLYSITKADEFYDKEYPSETPFILSPSFAKLVYSSSFLDFWNGLGRAGGWNLGVGVIGYSLPPQDEYARIGLYQMITNFQESWWTKGIAGYMKSNVKIVDLRKDQDGIDDLRKRYRFIDWSKADMYCKGFDSEAVQFLFRQDRDDIRVAT